MLFDYTIPQKVRNINVLNLQIIVLFHTFVLTNTKKDITIFYAGGDFLKLSIENLNSTDFDVTKIFAMNQKWENGAEFQMNHPRPTDALLYFCGSNALFCDKNGEDISIKKGDLFFIPHGSRYTWRFLNKHNGNEISCRLFEFLLIGDKGELIELSDCPVVIDGSRAGIFSTLFTSLVNERSRPQISLPAMKASAFAILAEFSRVFRENSVSERNFGCIYKGIRYLEDDLSQELSIAEIARLCNVSVNYFERLFKKYSGVTPTKFRLAGKIDRAKLMLETSPLDVEQLSRELNFSDSAYFCRIFKRIVGITPTQYRKVHRNFL